MALEVSNCRKTLKYCKSVFHTITVLVESQHLFENGDETFFLENFSKFHSEGLGGLCLGAELTFTGMAYHEVIGRWICSSSDIYYILHHFVVSFYKVALFEDSTYIPIVKWFYVVEAVSLLAVNIWNHYEGMDECPICYSVVHPTKKTLPKVRCGTCKGKFHRYCIYKWTKTSQKSTCPLCRSLI